MQECDSYHVIAMRRKGCEGARELFYEMTKEASNELRVGGWPLYSFLYVPYIAFVSSCRFLTPICLSPPCSAACLSCAYVFVAWAAGGVQVMTMVLARSPRRLSLRQPPLLLDEGGLGRGGARPAGAEALEEGRNKAGDTGVEVDGGKAPQLEGRRSGRGGHQMGQKEARMESRQSHHHQWQGKGKSHHHEQQGQAQQRRQGRQEG